LNKELLYISAVRPAINGCFNTPLEQLQSPSQMRRPIKLQLNARPPLPQHGDDAPCRSRRSRVTWPTCRRADGRTRSGSSAGRLQPRMPEQFLSVARLKCQVVYFKTTSNQPCVEGQSEPWRCLQDELASCRARSQWFPVRRVPTAMHAAAVTYALRNWISFSRQRQCPGGNLLSDLWDSSVQRGRLLESAAAGPAGVVVQAEGAAAPARRCRVHSSSSVGAPNTGARRGPSTCAEDGAAAACRDRVGPEGGDKSAVDRQGRAGSSGSAVSRLRRKSAAAPVQLQGALPRRCLVIDQRVTSSRAAAGSAPRRAGGLRPARPVRPAGFKAVPPGCRVQAVGGRGEACGRSRAAASSKGVEGQT
uniref:Uncharacterized protein n=1 Tax=Macrostomum lignano TaxID=282301 RepID=A0A1I8FQ79_9PLAT